MYMSKIYVDRAALALSLAAAISARRTHVPRSDSYAIAARINASCSAYRHDKEFALRHAFPRSRRTELVQRLIQRFVRE